MLIGLALRIGMTLRVSGEDAFAGWDGHEYYAYAQSILHGQWDNYARISQVIRPPFYPIFLTPFAALTSRIWPIQIAQCILGVILCFVLANIALRWRNQRAGNAALVLALVNPFLIYYCSFVLTETVFMSLLWSGMLCLLLLCEPGAQNQSKLLIIAGVILALACLTRPTLQPFLIVAALSIGWFSFKQTNLMKALARMAIFTMIVSAMILPFMIRNWRVRGDFSLSPYGTRLIHAMGNSPDYLRVFRSTTRQEYYRAQDEMARKASVDESPDVLIREAEDLRTHHSRDWWILQLYKFKHFWTPWLNPLIFSPAQVVLSAVAATPLFLLALVELWWQRRRLDRFVILLLGVIGTGYLVAGFLFHVQVRYRVPFVDVSFLLLSASLLGRFDFAALKQRLRAYFTAKEKHTLGLPVREY